MQAAASKGRAVLTDRDGKILWVEGPGDHVPPIGRFQHCGGIYYGRIHERHTFPDNRLDA